MPRVKSVTVHFRDGSKVEMDPEGNSPHVWPAPGQDADAYIRAARAHCGLDADDEAAIGMKLRIATLRALELLPADQVRATVEREIESKGREL